MISKEAFQRAALALRCEQSDIRTADEVESGGVGMQMGKDKVLKPIILFEPHVFWRNLVKAKLDPKKIIAEHNCADMLYPKWGEKPYPSGQEAQWARFERANKIHRDSAIKACSWGRYQILGENWKSTGSVSLQDFVNKMFKGDETQLDLWVYYLIATGLDVPLRLNKWKVYAEGYNGKYYYKDHYDTKLAAAKAKWVALLGR